MFNINIVATWSSVDNDCRSQGKDWTLAKQTKTHYTLYNLFLPRGMPSLSSLWPPITNLSQKQKQCSIVALYSFKAVGFLGEEDDVGHAEKNGVYSRADTESEVLWQIVSELLSSTLPVTPASKFAFLELTTRAAAPNCSLWKGGSWQSGGRTDGTGGVCFSLLVWILLTFCHRPAMSSQNAILPVVVWARN